MSEFSINLSSTADDDFFGSLKEAKSSKLQQLFVDDALSVDDKDQSLKYERPKDIDLATTCNTTSITLVAKIVTAYKQGDLQGKVGLALVQNIDDICSIIIYKAKAHILATLKLNPGMDLLYKQKNYWQFYDETSTYWSYSFDRPRDEQDFVEKLDIKNIKFKESHEREPISARQLNFSSFDNVAHGIISADIGNKPPLNDTRNSLIKRMAKMGKPLPTLSTTHQETAEFSDSSDTEVIQLPLISSQTPSITPKSNKLTSGKSNQQLVSSIVGISPVASSVYPINPLESQYMQMLLTEQRTQGSEIRMNMNKLENKIEKVLDKLELFDRNDVKQNVGRDDEILELEEKLLILKKENRKLKQNLQQIPLHHSQQNQYQDILFEFKEDFQKFNIDNNQGLKNVLFQLCNKLQEHESVIEKLEKNIKDNELQLEKATYELELSMKKNFELKNEISLLNQKENELRNQLNDKEAEVLKQKRAYLDLERKLLEKHQVSVENSNDVFLKSVMNNLFLDISDKLGNDSFSHSEQILSIIATSIKQQTLASLQKSIRKDNLN